MNEDLKFLAELLLEAKRRGNNFYVRCEPEAFDFTMANSPADLVIHAQGDFDPLRLTLDPANLRQIIPLLKLTIFAKDSRVVCWDMKTLFSYVLFHTRKVFEVGCHLVHLKALERFLGQSRAIPASLQEAMLRTRAIFADPNWGKAQKIYKTVTMPLISKVLPAIETLGILDTVRQCRVYPNYHVEGANNGRLSCDLHMASSFDPHGLTGEAKAVLACPQEDEYFLMCDFSSYEIFVLQWLSGDERLGQVVRAENVRGMLWKMVVGREMQDKDEPKAKLMFLPVIYGQSANSLSERLSIHISVAEQIIARMKLLFPKAFAYVQEVQDQAISRHVAEDYFGRRRSFPEKQHKARNLAVQAPASTVSLEKLVQLHKNISSFAAIAYHAHDGYAIVTRKRDLRRSYEIAKQTLEAESELTPGLKLRVRCVAGKTLGNMYPIESTTSGDN